jgi:hypothetical protein
MSDCRFFAKIYMNSHESTLTLTFVEIINHYRCVELVSLDLTPTPWMNVISEVKDDLHRMSVGYFKLFRLYETFK